jgi:hypothetical protein
MTGSGYLRFQLFAGDGQWRDFFEQDWHQLAVDRLAFRVTECRGNLFFACPPVF